MHISQGSLKTNQLLFISTIALLLWFVNSTESLAAVSFELPVDYLLEAAPTILHPADYDGDGDIDLAVVHSQVTGMGEVAISIHSNNGDGTYDLISTNITEAPVSITSADFDEDGDIDLATVNTASDNVSVLMNDGGGSFSLESTLEAGLVPGAITTIDFDNDGDTDLAVTIFDLAATEEEYHGDSDSSVVIFANDGTGSFTSTIVLSIPAESRGVAAADFNDDLAEDLVVFGYYGITIFLNNNDSTFSSSQVELQNGDYIFSAKPVDIDNDTDIDIVASKGGGEGNILIASNDGNGIFSYQQTLNVPFGADSFAVADLDSDGDIDLAVPTSGARLYVFTQESQGNFDLHDLFDLPYLTLNAPITSSDLNGDGKNDLAVGNGDGEIFRVSFIFQSLASNNPPILDQIDNQVIEEGQTLEFTISATDPDNDTLTYAAANLPAGATFNPTIREFSWTPGYSDAGNYTDIEFSVTDDGSPIELDVELITITVGDINRAPEFTNPGPQEVLENTSLTFNVSASDPDNDTVSITATNMPTGATFDGTVFNWTPTLAQEGIYTISFTATDNGTPNESALLEIVITVGDNPTPTEQAENLVDVVVTIDIPQNVENSYLANLQKVAQFILDGKIQAALNQLNAFITKVNQDRQQNILTQLEADSLIEAAEELIADITN